ncbi:MAG: hypothetical protein FWE90_07550 [Defluviitaleaceae bacterium]|nr:hypothetical protein [Defluviitaleaceae bacterium]
MNTRETVKDILANTVVFLLFFGGLASVYMIMFNELPRVYILLVVPFFILYLVRRLVFVKFTFFAIHGLCLTLPLLFASTFTEMIPFYIVVVLIIIYSLRIRTKREWRPETGQIFGLTLTFAAMFFLVFLFSTIYNTSVEEADRFFFAVALVAISSAILVTQMENIDNRLRFLPGRLKESSRAVLSVNNKLISAFMVILVTVGMLALFSPNIWHFMRYGVMVMLYALRTLFVLLTAPFHLVIRDEPEAISEALTDELLPDEEADTEPLSSLGYGDSDANLTMLYIFAAILIILPVVLLIYASRNIIKDLLKNFFNKASGDEEESLMPDDAMGKLKFLFGDIASFLPRFRSHGHPVRRAYAKKVNRHIKKGAPITLSDTPDKIADKIRPTENIDGLTAQYERVRYGK